MDVKGSFNRGPLKIMLKKSPPKASQVPIKMGMSYDAVPKSAQGGSDLDVGRASLEEVKKDSSTQVKGQAALADGQVSSSVSLQDTFGGGAVRNILLILIYYN